LIQSRYGWTDEIIHGLLFSRFAQLVSLLSEVRREEAEEKFTLAAFVGWQMGAGGNKTFGQYLKHLLPDLPGEPIQPAKPQKRQDEILSRMNIKAKRVKKS